MSKHTVVASTLAGLVAASGCMPVHATFIYMQGAPSSTALVRQAHHEVQAGAPTAGIMEFIASSIAGHEAAPRAQRQVQRSGWTLLPARLFAPDREARVEHPASSLPGAVDEAASDGALSAISVVDIAPSTVQAPAAQSELPVSSIDALLADVSLVDDTLTGSDVQAVPDPSSVGLLGVGLLLTFFASRRVRRTRERDLV